MGIAILLMPGIASAQGMKTNGNKMKTGTAAMSLEKNMEEQEYRIPENPEDISPLLIGESIPMVSLKDVNGKGFDLNRAIASKPTILIFYRGGWCPYCTRQLSGLQELLPELETMGYQLIAVSTDSPDELSKSLDKAHLGYTLLSDADLNVSKKFGLAFKAPKGYSEMLVKTTGGLDQDLLLPVPSVFILDKMGKIQYEYINTDFKQRLNPELLKVVAQTIYKVL
ncbi:Peroxiredoxin [Pedobacter steynii]|uniref:thioredoxin-dependent peroxiredoxin n=2 Tax=Pedobacter steynii TaxID=430522 RepID=A0A1H0JN25_9SPHI|nr:Peroxiredoxin [Pedobacter steynii]